MTTSGGGWKLRQLALDDLRLDWRNPRLPAEMQRENASQEEFALFIDRHTTRCKSRDRFLAMATSNLQYIHKGHALRQLGIQHAKIISGAPQAHRGSLPQLNSYVRSTYRDHEILR